MRIKSQYFGIVLALIVFVAATGLSYLALDQYYGEEDTRIKEQSGTAQDEGPVPLSRSPGNQYLPLTIGASMGIVSLIGWIASRQLERDATTVLLEEGLEDMTVRDVNIVRHMMTMEQFTVPELVEKTDVSRTSVWRLVKRMDESDLVEETGDEKLPKSGRGKPSKVYKYIGP